MSRKDRLASPRLCPDANHHHLLVETAEGNLVAGTKWLQGTYTQSFSVPRPQAFVLDVGIIKRRGWAVVEPNACWGAGIYGCTPSKVLEVLLAATVQKKATKGDLKWDYAEYYFRACPHMKDRQNW